MILPEICAVCQDKITQKKAALDEDKLLLSVICKNGHEELLNGEDFPEEKEHLKKNLKLLESMGK